MSQHSTLAALLAAQILAETGVTIPEEKAEAVLGSAVKGAFDFALQQKDTLLEADSKSIGVEVKGVGSFNIEKIRFAQSKSQLGWDPIPKFSPALEIRNAAKTTFGIEVKAPAAPPAPKEPKPEKAPAAAKEAAATTGAAPAASVAPVEAAPAQPASVVETARDEVNVEMTEVI